MLIAGQEQVLGEVAALPSFLYNDVSFSGLALSALYGLTHLILPTIL
jgi:hypothetical protein